MSRRPRAAPPARADGHEGPDQAKGQSGQAAGERALANTAYRSLGEIVGRLASLALFAVVARRLGENGLGAFVFAVAFLGFVMVAVDLGLDRYMLRAVAREHSAAHHFFFNVLALKVVLAAPLFALSLLGLHLVGYGTQAQATALALAPGVLFDSIARTQASLFAAHERGGPPSVADAFQRICSAAFGIAALGAGYGVVAVAVTYSLGSFIGVVVGFVLLRRTIGTPARAVSRRSWRSLATSSIPFAAQDVFTVLLARMDTLLLSLIATQAAVGRYGAAYRLFESTFFVTYALVGSFAAMFTRLSPDGDPPLRFAFQRSVKLALILLMPVAVVCAVLAYPLCQLIYGTTFGSAAPLLRILAFAIVPISVVTLSIGMLVSRESPRRLIALSAGMAAFNITLNLILIPLYSDTGAAVSMLATVVVYVFWVTGRAVRAVGGRIPWAATLAGPAAGGIAMTAVGILLRDHLFSAIAAGSVVYLVVLCIVERLASPEDAAFAVSMLRRRLPARVTGQPRA